MSPHLKPVQKGVFTVFPVHRIVCLSIVVKREESVYSSGNVNQFPAGGAACWVQGSVLELGITAKLTRGASRVVSSRTNGQRNGLQSGTLYRFVLFIFN